MRVASGVEIMVQRISGRRLLAGRLVVKLRRLLRDRDGVTAMEYGLIAAAVTTAIVSILNGVSPVVGNMFSRISTSI